MVIFGWSFYIKNPRSFRTGEILFVGEELLLQRLRDSNGHATAIGICLLISGAAYCITVGFAGCLFEAQRIGQFLLDLILLLLQTIKLLLQVLFLEGKILNDLLQYALVCCKHFLEFLFSFEIKESHRA